MKRFERFIELLAKRQWSETRELQEWQVRKARYVKPGVYEFETEDWRTEAVERLNDGYGTTYFLRRGLRLPEGWAGQEAALLYQGGGEGLLSLDGSPFHGLDKNHWFVPLPKGAANGELQIDIELYDPIPEPADPLNRQASIKPPISGISLTLVCINLPVYSLLHTVKTAHEAAKLLPERDMRRIRLERALEKTMDALYTDEKALADGAQVSEAERQLVQVVSGVRDAEGLNGTMHLVGQSHIDVAWLWPVRETVRKVGRTFSTVCALMDRYPQFYYSQSQPQLYAFVKEQYPELFEKIRARVAEGRWELVGGMWVEPDLNLPGGESLARQILYGQGFYKQEFGRCSTIEWLPDTFGYCASLPQLLKQAGIDYFMTTKLGWNDTNTFPYTLFHWVGIDGTSVIAYQNHGLNEHTLPKDMQEHWAAFKEKDRYDELMLLYGHGDGGGGVTHEMLEYASRPDLMPGQPTGQFSTAAAFFSEIGKRRPELPTWSGDLYLELHRGTYTTQAWNKRANRKAEVLYREAEIWGRLARIRTGEEIPSLNEGWKLLLLNQFHDIIPGSSITEVYETSREQYRQIFETGHAVLDRSLHALAAEMNTAGDGQPYLVFNSLGWEREGVVYLEGDSTFAALRAFDAAGPLAADAWLSDAETGKFTLAVRVPAIPAFGCRTIWLREAEGREAAGTGAAGAEIAGTKQADAGRFGTERTGIDGAGNGRTQTMEACAAPGKDEPFPDQWENEWHLLRFNEQGEIVRWFDKEAGRELLPAGQKGNQLQLFHDTPVSWDAWDVDPRFEEQPADRLELIGKKLVASGATGDILLLCWKLSRSVIEQKVFLYKHTRRVDFQTKVQWHEDHKLLKVAFPVDILAAKATYEIPFGALERPTHRNTSWEQAQFEVCGHRWADLSESGYGASLMNDCKYGYDVRGNVLRLSLLRSPSWPDRTADRGEHLFTYSLYPHDGDWRQGHVVREAADLNVPLQVLAAEKHAGGPSETGSCSWLRFRSEHVVLETVKEAEDGTGTIIRLYESTGGRGTATLAWDEENVRACTANLLEEESGELPVDGGVLKLDFKPFEIRTVKLVH